MKAIKRIEHHGGGGGAVYGLGMIGAAVYFLQHANGLGEILMGLIKSVFWPGFLIYRVLEVLKM